MIFEQRLFELLKEESITDLLRILLQEDGATPKQLSERIGIGAPFVNRRLAELETVGLVGRGGALAKYHVLFPERTGALLQAAADLVSDVLTHQAAEAVERSKLLSKALQSPGGGGAADPW